MSKPSIIIHDDLDLREVKDRYIDDQWCDNFGKLLIEHARIRRYLVKHKQAENDKWKQQLRACGVEVF